MISTRRLAKLVFALVLGGLLWNEAAANAHGKVERYRGPDCTCEDFCVSCGVDYICREAECVAVP